MAEEKEPRVDKELVAGNILAERNRRRWSRDKLAEVSGIPGSTLKTYENAESGISLENACVLADLFDMDLDEFAGRNRKAS